MKKDTDKKSIIKKIILAIIFIAFPFVAKNILNWNYGIQLACFFMLYVVAVSGLDLLFGYSGQISLGHAAYFAIGSYGSAMLNKYCGVPVFFSILIGACIATVFGALLAYPASKLVFHFLSLATIAFGEIVYQLVAQSPGKITGNFTGMFPPTISFFGYSLNSFTKYYFYSLVCVVVFLVIKKNLVNSRVGRAFIAIRENATAANGMGINVRKYKVIAFATSAFFTAYAGGMYAHLVRFISPDTYTQKQSVMFLTMLLFGGTGSVGGTVAGVFSVQVLNELLRTAQRYQLLIYGILLLIVIVAFPGGVYGLAKDIFAKIKGKGKGDEADA